MKKKIFFQLHFGIFIVNGCIMLFVLGGLSILIRDPLCSSLHTGNTFIDFSKTIIMWIGIIFFAWQGITYNRHWITFTAECIYVPSDWRIKCDRRQHRVEVKYENIVDISYIRSTKNSRNKTIKEESMNPFYHQYMVLHLKNGRKERIMVDYYTKNQKVKILEELKRRLEDCENTICLANAQETLKNLGTIGAKFAIEIVEKIDQKKNQRKPKFSKEEQEKINKENQ